MPPIHANLTGWHFVASRDDAPTKHLTPFYQVWRAQTIADKDSLA
jgi:hypothetical protein